MHRRAFFYPASCKIRRLLPFTSCFDRVADSSLLCGFTVHGKNYSCQISILNLGFVINPFLRCGGISSTAYRILVLGQHLKHFCTSEPLELENSSISTEIDGLDKVHKTVLDYANPEYKMEEALDNLGVHLTTPLVMEVIHRLRFDEKLAFRFFTWAGHDEHYSHEPQCYNKMIDLLSSTKYKAKQFRVVCDVLDYMKRSNKRSVPIDVLLMILRQYAEKHLSHLQKFSKRKKTKVKSQPEINSLNLLLDALCKCCLVEEAEAMLHRVKSKVNPNSDTYNILFFGWCRVRNPSRGIGILKHMINMGHTPDNFTYNTAIDTFCKAGMLTEAAELLEFMKTKGATMSSPTARTYSIMIIALAQNHKMDQCLEMIADMMSSGALPDVSTFKEIMEGLYLSGKAEAAYKFLDEMGKTGYPPDIVTYNCFLKILCKHDDSEEALRLYKGMMKIGCIPSVQTYNIMMDMFFRMRDADGAFETWEEMERSGCLPDTQSYCGMIEGLFGCGNSQDAIFVLDKVMDKGMMLSYKKFDEILMHLSAVGDLKAIQRLSEHMRKSYNPAMARRFAVSQKRRSLSLRGR